MVAMVLNLLADDSLNIPLLPKVVENVILASEPTEWTAKLFVKLYKKVLQYFQVQF